VLLLPPLPFELLSLAKCLPVQPEELLRDQSQL